IGDVPIDQVTTRDVQRLVNEVAAEHSADTARKALTALRVLMKYGDHPLGRIIVPGDGRVERPPRILTLDECEAILRNTWGDDFRVLFEVLFQTGLRVGEALGLVWGPRGIDLAESVIHVTQAVERTTREIIAPKSRHSVRVVPLDSAFTQRLRQHRLATGR